MDSNFRLETWLQRHHSPDIWVSCIDARFDRVSPTSREYLNRLFFHATAADASPDGIPQWAIKLTASFAVIIVSILCVATPKLATRVAVLFTSVKVRSHSSLSRLLNHDR
jgi:hypothetical protein